MRFLVVSLALASTASALGQSDKPPVTLVPAHPPGHDAYNLDHLVPDVQQSLHFRESGMSEEDTFSFGNINSTFNHPTVLLDHSSHVESVTCSDSDNLKVCFTNKEAKDHARESWGNALGDSGSLVFSTNHPGCSGYSDGARGYWMASSADFGSGDSSCVHVNSTEVPLDEALDNFELEFGQNNDTSPDQDAQQNQSPSATTVDITDDPEQLAGFFQHPITETYPDVPEMTPRLHNGTAVIPKRAVLYRRNIIDDIGNAINKGKDAILNAGKKVIDVAKKVVNAVVHAVIDLGKQLGKLIVDPKGFAWDLGTNVQKTFNLGAPGTFKHRTKTGLFGNGEGIAIDGNRALPVDLTCDNCYARGTIVFGGRIVGSTKEGVKQGYVAVAGNWNSRLALAMKLQGQYSVNLLKQELLAVNLVELQIPGFLSIGPQVSITAEVDLSFNAEADILIGATLDMGPSGGQLDFFDNHGSWAAGFRPVLTPFAKFRGEPSLKATLGLGLPLAIEFGVDVLSGKWKRTVGLVDRPSFAVTAEKSGTSGCSNGIQIGLSIDNEIYASADVWKQYKYDFRVDNLWKKSLACIEGPKLRSRASRKIGARDDGNGTSENDVDEDVPYDIQNPRAAVNRTFPDGVLTQPPRAGLTPANSSVPQPVTRFAYNNVITDLNKTAVLFAGKEDRLYLGPYAHPALVTGTQFASQPNASESIVLGDIYGGYINYNPDEMSSSGVSNLRSSRLTNVPKGSKFISLAEIRSDELKDLPGMYVGLAGDQIYALATCKVVDKGTRMYVVDVNKDGMDRLNKNELADSVVGGQVEECQYAYLTSGREGLELGAESA